MQKLTLSKSANGYYPPLVINLDKKNTWNIGEEQHTGTFSQYLKAKYDENKNNFKDAYSFIHNVLPGFYVHNTSGEGSILYIGDIWLRMKVSYYITGSEGQDSLVYTSIPFAATNEVFMSTRLNNSEDALDKLAEEKNSYLPENSCRTLYGSKTSFTRNV